MEKNLMLLNKLEELQRKLRKLITLTEEIGQELNTVRGELIDKTNQILHQDRT